MKEVFIITESSSGVTKFLFAKDELDSTMDGWIEVKSMALRYESYPAAKDVIDSIQLNDFNKDAMYGIEKFFVRAN